jgi:hypothetical protein
VGGGGGSGQQDAAHGSLSHGSVWHGSKHGSKTAASSCSPNTPTPTNPHSAPLQLLAMRGTVVENGGDMCRGLAAAEAALGMRLVSASEALAACGDVEESRKLVDLIQHCLAALQAVQSLSNEYTHA